MRRPTLDSPSIQNRLEPGLELTRFAKSLATLLATTARCCLVACCRYFAGIGSATESLEDDRRATLSTTAIFPHPSKLSQGARGESGSSHTTRIGNFRGCLAVEAGPNGRHHGWIARHCQSAGHRPSDGVILSPTRNSALHCAFDG